MSAITDEMTGVFANTGTAFREIHSYPFFTTVRRDALCGSVEIWSPKHCNLVLQLNGEGGGIVGSSVLILEKALELNVFHHG